MKEAVYPKKSVPFLSSERGGLTPLMLILIIALVSFVALAIDSHRLFTSVAEKQNTADFAALGALESFLLAGGNSETFSAVTPQQRFSAAKQRAESIARGNRTTASYGRAHLAANEYLSTSLQQESVNSISGNPGTIQAGRWLTASDCSTCSCGSPPCFDVCPFGVCSDSTLASAMQVTLRTTQSSLVPATFSRIFNSIGFRVSGSGVADGGTGSVASITPIHTVILVDVGRGMGVDNTWFSERGGTDTVVGARPEPASTALDVLYYLLNRYRTTSRSQDRIAWVLYDNRVDRGGFRNQNTLVSPAADAVTNALVVFNPTNASTRSLNGVLPLPGTGSDLDSALALGRNILAAASDFAAVQNNIVVISNGMVDNCNPLEPSAAPSNSCPRYVPSPEVTADRQYRDWNTDLQAISGRVRTVMEPSSNIGVKILVDLMPIGSAVHTVLRQRPGTSSTTCLTSREMLPYLGMTAIVPGGGDQFAKKQRFLQLATSPFPRRAYDAVEWLYALSRNQGSSWLPILPPCNVSIVNSCSGGGSVMTTPPSGLANGMMDPDGRLFCDPRGISIQQQVDSYTTFQIFSPAIKLVGK